jgi:hypothetical protein
MAFGDQKMRVMHHPEVSIQRELVEKLASIVRQRHAKALRVVKIATCVAKFVRVLSSGGRTGTRLSLFFTTGVSRARYYSRLRF